MNRSVVIFGTWHHFPNGLLPPSDHHHFLGYEHHVREFDQLIRRLVDRHAVVAVVEELGDDFLPDLGGASHLSRLIHSLGLEYKNTDLTEDERAEAAQQLGLKTWREKETPDWWRLQEAREAHWLRDLCGVGRWPALFVCGGIHSSRFRDLAARNHLDPIIEEGYWDPPSRESN